MWADGIPNLLIGLREGLEGGLVVSILLAAVRCTGRRNTSVSIWTGVAAAVVLALCFGAVLTFSRVAMATTAQEAFSGIGSVIAVGMVTGMIFWMRRTARSLAGELRSKVHDALQVGSIALVATAFLAVGREGLETALFLWTTVQASGHTIIPLAGALLGILLAVGLCWALYRRVITLNVGVFFSRTAIALVVIAAGVFAYGLGDLQGAGLLPGHTWLAFDLSRHLSVDTWWVTIISGVTNLRPTMTWLQIVGYVGYLGVVLTVLLRKPVPAKTPVPSVPAPEAVPPSVIGVPKSRAPIRSVSILTGLVVLPLAITATVITLSPRRGNTGSEVRITADACAPEWTSASAGSRTFTVVNNSDHSGEIYLLDTRGGILGELEGLGPSTRQNMPITLPDGDYQWRCLLAGQPARTSAVAHITGSGSGMVAAAAVKPVSEDDLADPVAGYRTYVAAKLTDLTAQVDALRASITAEDLPAARRNWQTAQLTWQQVGAAYGSFGDLAKAINGLPAGLPQGVSDPAFTGLRRIEYGLWHGQPAATLTSVADKLAADLAELQAKLPQLTVDPRELPLRAHEILEDALRDHLTGATDQGAGISYAATDADVQGTRVVLNELAPLITARRPDLLPTANIQLDTLTRALAATRQGDSWTRLSATPLAARQKVNAALGALLETLSLIPNLLEVRNP